MYIEGLIAVAITLVIGIYIFYQFLPLVNSIDGISPVVVTLLGLVAVVLVAKFVMSIFA